MPEIMRCFDGKKFMWDGKVYDSRTQAEGGMQDYGKNAFETRMIEDAGKFCVYTRRVAAQQAAVEG